MQRRSASAAIKRGDRVIVDGVVRSRGRHTRNWVVAIRKDLKIHNLAEEMALNRTELKKQIYVANPNILEAGFVVV